MVPLILLGFRFIHSGVGLYTMFVLWGKRVHLYFEQLNWLGELTNKPYDTTDSSAQLDVLFAYCLTVLLPFICMQQKPVSLRSAWLSLLTAPSSFGPSWNTSLTVCCSPAIVINVDIHLTSEGMALWRAPQSALKDIPSPLSSRGSRRPALLLSY